MTVVCYFHLVGRGQGFCQIPCYIQEQSSCPTRKNDPARNVSHAEVDNLRMTTWNYIFLWVSVFPTRLGASQGQDSVFCLILNIQHLGA